MKNSALLYLVIATSFMCQRSPATAQALEQQFLQNLANQEREALYSISVTNLGPSTEILTACPKFMHPMICSHYVLNSTGDAEELNTTNLLFNLKKDYPTCHNVDIRKHITDTTVRWVGRHGPRQIASVNDIPNFDNSPLDESTAQQISPPDFSADASWTVYTYQQVGGIVRRYDFVLNEALVMQSIVVTELGTDIGAAQYLE